jgi:hypothetical protein
VAENLCLQEQYAWRGFFAEALARGDGQALEEALAASTPRAPQRQEDLRAYQRLTRELGARAPEQGSEGEDLLTGRTLTREDWSHYHTRLERTAAGPEALARRQCVLLALALPDCEPRLRDSLMARLDFEHALPPEPSVSAPTEADAVR